MEVREQLRVGSGLGGSSVLAVALARACLALEGRRAAPTRLVALLKDLEAGVLHAPTGCQDYYPALLGGTLAVRLAPGGEVVQRLPRRHPWVERRLVVIDTGISHHSGLVNWEVYRRRVEGDAQTASALAAIAEAARECRAALVASDEAGVGRAIAAEWRARRRLAPEVSSAELERVIEAGVGAGAWAGKACGAGGGGCVLLWSAPQRRETVAAAALAAAGAGARRVSTAPRPPSLTCEVALA
jgi:D-glycero-alpha-D-manno-heptose-7-phosphate kinase